MVDYSQHIHTFAKKAASTAGGEEVLTSKSHLIAAFSKVEYVCLETKQVVRLCSTSAIKCSKGEHSRLAAMCKIIFIPQQGNSQHRKYPIKMLVIKH